ncbi:hypothetical protein [Rhodococcus sp. D-46]|uniref:hypothetical protein n=1 Tax=Rhodococcus sp. D-46 TaxID=2716265 RepID=UPI001A98F392
MTAAGYFRRLIPPVDNRASVAVPRCTIFRVAAYILFDIQPLSWRELTTRQNLLGCKSCARARLWGLCGEYGARMKDDMIVGPDKQGFGGSCCGHAGRKR